MKDKLFQVFCVFFGHSRIQKSCFGYFYCGRCGEQVGDAVGSVYYAGDVVIVGHNCGKCHANYKKLIWHEKLFTPDPFAKLHNRGIT